MANVLTTNPIYLDTFSADIVLSNRPMQINSILFYSGTNTDNFTIEDKNGVPVIQLLANQTWSPAESFSFNNPPYTVDVSDGAYAATARAFIYS
jgi:hypothetical protein